MPLLGMIFQAYYQNDNDGHSFIIANAKRDASYVVKIRKYHRLLTCDCQDYAARYGKTVSLTC